MQLSLVDLDERVEALRDAEFRAAARVRKDFVRRFMLCWVYHELNLEGIVVAERDLHRALSGRTGTDYCDDQLLQRVRRYYKAIERLKVAVEGREPLSLRLLLHYAEILNDGVPEPIFRDFEGATGAYKHDTDPPVDLEAQLAEILAESNACLYSEHPLRLSIEVHYRLTRLWPFALNNAAIARLVADHILMVNGYPPAIIHAHDRQRYYQSMHYDVSRMRRLLQDSMLDQILLREREILGERAVA